MRKAIKPLQKVLLWAGAILLLVLAVSFLAENIINNQQSADPVLPVVRFEGTYQIADGPEQPIVHGAHIPATEGDVTLRGIFRMYTADMTEDLGPVSEGTKVALYCNHIRVQVTEGDGPTFSCDPENPIFGDDACGAFWSAYYCQGTGDITISIHNPHKFGNVNAADQLLDNMAIYADRLFEDSVRDRGNIDRGFALLFLLCALVMLGISLFLRLVHIRSGRELFFIGMMTLFAGAYFLFSSPGICFWSNSRNIIITSTKGLSMMFYMLTLDMLIVSFLDSFSGKLGLAAVAGLGLAEIVIVAIPLLSDIYFYDLWMIWMLLQVVVGVVLLSCLLYGIHDAEEKRRKGMFIGLMLPIMAFLLDALATSLGWWQGGTVSKGVFVGLFVIILFLVMWVIPGNINAAARAKELETEQKVLQAELQRSRVATMMSQIQPHFIYNTLSSIELLCMEKPEDAAKLVRSFSEYLQGNFRNVEDASPIPFSREIQHVKHYTDVEQVRFADMTIRYDLKAVDFLIPPLTVQPLVENAIKHGLMGLEEGGTVTVMAEETPTHYCVCVSDDGVGFDVQVLGEDQRHVGIRNIRERLKAICGGTLEIQSTPGKGTTAWIRIPKH